MWNTYSARRLGIGIGRMVSAQAAFELHSGTVAGASSSLDQLHAAAAEQRLQLRAQLCSPSVRSLSVASLSAACDRFRIFFMNRFRIIRYMYCVIKK